MNSQDAFSKAVAPTPDAAMIKTFSEVVFSYCDGLVAARSFPEKGTAKTKVPHLPFLKADAGLATALTQQAVLAVNNGMALYVVPGTVAPSGKATAKDVVQTQVILVDLDHGDIQRKRDYLVSHFGAATLEVASGGITAEGQRKLHLYWRLTEPADGDEIAFVCRLRHIIAVKVGGDPSFQSAHQPIRVAGSIHLKNERPCLVTVIASGNAEYDLKEFAEKVIAMPPLEGEGALWRETDNANATKRTVTELFRHPIREGGSDGTTRFSALSSVIGYWIRRYQGKLVTKEQAWEEIVAYNEARIVPPWPIDRLRKETQRLWEREQKQNDRKGKARQRKDAAMSGDDSDIVPVEFTEDALASNFTQKYAEDWRYVAHWGYWLVWNGKFWQRENTLFAYDLSRRICRQSASICTNHKLSGKISSASTVAAVEELARSDRRHAATTEIWDCDHLLLNTPGGVVDLRTGVLSPPAREHCMTKIATASPQGDCPLWRQFLITITNGDVALQSYLQRVVGYCLTGLTSEHALFFLYGTGANGKSVFVNTITVILGDYATVAAMDMFMATTGDRHPTDMAGLRGARVVTSIETEQGRRWAESKIKALTGGDKITARFMRQDFFEFTPQFKLLIAGNHKPAIRNVDEAMRRRLHMVPFIVTIPTEKRDKQLPDRLLAERDGILAWAVAGCLEWQRKGLLPPPAVMAATEEYFAAEDALGRWLDERCERGNSFSEATSALFSDWKAWAEQCGEFIGSIKRFAENLINRKLEPYRGRSSRGFRGLRLRNGTGNTTEMEF